MYRFRLRDTILLAMAPLALSGAFMVKAQSQTWLPPAASPANPPASATTTGTAAATGARTPAGAAGAARTATPTAPTSILQFVPSGMAALSQQATWHTDFTLDRSTLALAGNLYGVDDPTRLAIARLNGVALHLCRFPAGASYDAGAVESIRTEYGTFGWKHFSTTKQQPGEPLSEPAGRTDVWLDTHGINIAGAAILMAGPSNVNLITIAGDLSTLDILHLRGHFGIPKFGDDALPH